MTRHNNVIKITRSHCQKCLSLFIYLNTKCLPNSNELMSTRVLSPYTYKTGYGISSDQQFSLPNVLQRFRFRDLNSTPLSLGYGSTKIRLFQKKEIRNLPFEDINRKFQGLCQNLRENVGFKVSRVIVKLTGNPGGQLKKIDTLFLENPFYLN